MKIGDIKVGEPIVWLKASKDNQFISEYVLDLVQFDEYERVVLYGNPDYMLSNIYQFLNSTEDYTCYAPTHPNDRIGQSYVRKDGFLSLFDPHELASLDGCVDLPSVADIHGSEDRVKLDLFKKKGFRAKCKNASSYSSYFTCDNSGDRVLIIPRSGEKTEKISPYWVSGVRPKCKLKADIEVEQSEDKIFHIIPFECVSDQDDGYDESDFRALLGI